MAAAVFVLNPALDKALLDTKWCRSPPLAVIEL